MLNSANSLTNQPNTQKELHYVFNQAMKAKGDDYQPRTEHFNADGSVKYINRLILEQSPYLIQHAHNPVNWYAWGKEAFAKAERENKPVFLSIGYSTCHWCHVMERESFDNEKVAAYLNKHFIAIKVDRERRPAVDKLYMTALMVVQGRGGWPMSSFLTPQGKPFLSGTYYPEKQFMKLLQRTSQLWAEQETRLREVAQQITEQVKSRQANVKQAEHIGQERVQMAVITLLNRLDELQGGFSHAPKFPNESTLFLLLDAAVREQNKEALQALELTMSLMAQGGIYDQVGGGFHRYATDNAWLVPHFEKMLYNQAHLANTYLQLYQITQNEAYKRVVTQTLDYVLRDMQTNQHAFFSASDADSEGQEGKFFLWALAQLYDTLTPEQVKLAIAVYAIRKEGNFSDDPALGALPSGEGGTTIINLPVSLAEFAKLNKLDLAQLYQNIDSIRTLLYKKRQLRIAPAIDKKVVTAWNAMMITALAQAGNELNNDVYIKAAQDAAEFIWQIHYDKTSVLWRSSLNGKTSVVATQADYAYLAQSYLSLYDITEDKKWLTRSQQLVKKMIDLFWDKDNNSFFMSAEVDKTEQSMPLFERPKDLYDGAIPAANAIALEVLSKLYYRTAEEHYQTKATAMIASLSSTINESPSAFSYFLMAVNQFNLGELADIQYGAKGHIRLEKQQRQRQQQLLLEKDKTVPYRIEVDILLAIDKNWHINSRYPNDKDLRPSSITLSKASLAQWKIIKAEYPADEELQLKFNDTPLSLYHDSVKMSVTLEALVQQPKKIIPLEVSYQSCNQHNCLAPEKNTFYIFADHNKNN